MFTPGEVREMWLVEAGEASWSEQSSISVLEAEALVSLASRGFIAPRKADGAMAVTLTGLGKTTLGRYKRQVLEESGK